MIPPVRAADRFGGENSDIDEMGWTVPTYKRDRVNIAGRELLEAMFSDFDRWTSPEWTAYFEHLEVINNWRASHAYPLVVMRMTLGSYARKVDADALVAQRIKRLVSIGAKLNRERNMKLSQMQDIGGCRAANGARDSR